MKRSRLTQEQIIGLFKEHQAGTTVVDLCRKHGVSDATFYMWRPNCGGMAVSDARKPKGLEEENALLKKLLAQSILDVSTLRVMLAEASDAPLAACSRNLDDPGKKRCAASRLQLGGHSATNLPLCVAAAPGCELWQESGDGSAIAALTFARSRGPV